MPYLIERKEQAIAMAMTVQLPSVPFETRKAATRVFLPKNIYLHVGNCLEQIFEGVDLSILDPSNRYNTERLCRLALITAFQFAENLSDLGAARALHSRLDWMYALHLPINYPEIQPYTLCEFREALNLHPAAQSEFIKLLDRLKEEGLFASSKYWAAANSEAVIVVCNLTRLDRIKTSIQACLETLSAIAPEWLRMIMPAHWYKRYDRSANDHPVSCRVATQQLMALELGRDMIYLIEAIDRLENREINQKPEVVQLREVWHQQFSYQQGQAQWRKDGCLHCNAEKLF